MILFWRGWGIAVALLFVFWFFAGIALVVVASPYEPDKHKALMDVQWGFAGVFALYALSVWAAAALRRYRLASVADGPVQTAASPSGDHFMFLRLEWWPYILFAVALLFAGASYLGRSVFGS